MSTRSGWTVWIGCGLDRIPKSANNLGSIARSFRAATDRREMTGKVPVPLPSADASFGVRDQHQHTADHDAGGGGCN